MASQEEEYLLQSVKMRVDLRLGDVVGRRVAAALDDDGSVA